MKKKKARTATKRRSTKKRASSVKKKRKPSTRRRKTTAKRAASRASNPRRKKKRAVTKRRKVAKRRTSARKTAAPKRRRKRRSNPAPVVGYELRSANPKKRKKRKSSKRRKSAKITASKLASMLRSLAKRKSNPSLKLGGRSSRGGSASALVSAAELKRAGLLDATSRLQDIQNSIDIITDQIAEIGDSSPELRADLEIRRAQLVRQKQDVGSGMGLLDAAILSADTGPLADLREGLLSAAEKRRLEAAKRAAISSQFKEPSRQKVDYFAALAAKSALEAVDASLDRLETVVPAMKKEYTAFSLVSGKKGSRRRFNDITALKFDNLNGQAALLSLPPESIGLAIQMLQRNYIPAMTPDGSMLRAQIDMAIDKLQGLMSGRIENPRRGRRRKAKGRSLKRGRRRKRRASNPRKKRKSGKRKSSKRKGRKRRSGRRRKNPLGGLDLLGKLSSNASIGEKAMAAGRIALGATVGYASVGIGQWLMGMEVGGKSINKLLNGLGLSPAVSVTASAALASAASAAIVVGVGNAVTAVKSDQIPALIGIGARFLHALIDANWRDTSNTSKVLRSAVGLPSTVSGYGSWNPIGGYYNFQPVMAGPPKAGYQVAMAGAPRAGYSVSGMKPGYMLNGDMKAGYTVNGYANYAPAMAGYANFSPEMPVPKKNPMGSPF